jgi:5'-3' exonuclease
MPVIQFMFRGIEADDVIAYITKTKYLSGWEKVIVSSDKDFFQLLDDETILYRPIQKKIVNKNSLIEEFDIHPNNFAMARAMAGDKSDNLNGVGGLGLKTVAKRYPFLKEENSATINDVVTYSKDMLLEKNIKAYNNVVENADILERNYHIMQLYTPSMSINSKKHVNDALLNPDLSFNKTEIIKMMSVDGFEDLDWTELQAFYRRIALDN